MCPGSLAACKALPEEPPKIYSARGTLKHTISERCLKENLDPASFLETVHEVDGFTFDFDKGMVAEVASYVNAIRGSLGKRLVEVWLDTAPVFGVPNQGGTGDVVMLNRQIKSCDVHDAKFGYIEVSATEGVEFGKKADGTPLQGNPQGLIYLAAAVIQFDIYDEWKQGSFHIHQPSNDHYDFAEYTREEIEQFIEWVRPRAQRAWKMYIGEIPVELVPGKKQCTWCPLKACAARAQQFIDMFDPVGAEPEPEMFELDDESVAAAITIAEDAIEWGNDLIAEAQRRALRGSKLSGYKLVKGKRGARFWKNKEAALDALSLIVDREELFTPGELKSPTQVEELVGNEHYARLTKLVDQTPGSLKLVPESARGAEVSVTPAEFGIVTSQQEN